MQFNRQVRLTLQFGALIKEFSNPYKIDFDITKSVGGTFESGSITVTGLTSSDIATMASFYEYNKAVLLPNTITLIAGYKNNIQSIIFIGSAQEAKPSFDTSDKSISFEVSSAYYSNELNAISVSYQTTTLSAIMLEIAAKLNLALNFTAVDKVIKNYAFQGQLFEQLNGLRKMYKNDIYIYISNSMLCVVNADSSLIAAPLVCSLETGMVGTPEPTFLGCDVKMLLQPTIIPGALVNVVSRRLPKLTGTYRAMNIRHTGSTRDSYFYTEIQCAKELNL